MPVFKISQLPSAPNNLLFKDTDYVLLSRPAVGETYKTTLGSLANAIGDFLNISSDSAVFSSLNPSDGQVLTYDGTTKQWIAANPTGGNGSGGGAVNIIGDIVYDSNSGIATVKKIQSTILDLTNQTNLALGNRTTPYGIPLNNIAEGDVLQFAYNDSTGIGAFVPSNMFGVVKKMTSSSPHLSGGYQWLPSGSHGCLVKWGVATLTVSSPFPDSTQIIFPATGDDKLGPDYDQACWAVYTTLQGSTSAICMVDALNKTGFTAKVWGAAGTYTLSWLSLGV